MKKTLIYTTKLRSLENMNVKTFNGEKVDMAVKFPMNAIIGDYIKFKDDVNVIILKNTSGDDDHSNEIVEECKKECIETLKDKQCNLSFSVVPMFFDGEKENLKQCYLDLLNALEYKTEIYFDMTYGPKFLPFVSFAAFDYTEKFFDSNVKKIFYGQVYFDDNGKIKDGSEKLCDLTFIYRMDAFCKDINMSSNAFKLMLKTLVS